MRTFLIHMCSITGTWFCLKAIRLADRGHLDFEVDVPCKQPVIVYHNKPRRKSQLGTLLVAALVTGLAVWSVLTLAFSIENAGQEVVEELKREHRQEMRQKAHFLPNYAIRY